MDVEQLENELREIAFKQDCELVVERVQADRWRAAFKQFTGMAAIGPHGAIILAAEHGDRRGALEQLRALAS
ncbi:MAG TPA: hypothetical protein VNY35_01405 [Solirubrobacteraceae bacterium]|jgi:hypothetical protein|nr:hypothetical protein [Solirubrobacteraceae bacterium]